MSFKSLLHYAWEKTKNVLEIMAYIRLVVRYSKEVWDINREDQMQFNTVDWSETKFKSLNMMRHGNPAINNNGHQKRNI